MNDTEQARLDAATMERAARQVAHDERVKKEIAWWEGIDAEAFDNVAANYRTELEVLKAEEARIHEEVGNTHGALLRFDAWRRNTARAKTESAGRAKAMKITVRGFEVSVALVEPGHEVEHRGKNSWGDAKKITVGKVFEVSDSASGEVLGFVFYDMMTRETRTPGRMYVNSRWQSPGWSYGKTRSAHKFETSSKKDAIERIVREATR